MLRQILHKIFLQNIFGPQGKTCTTIYAHAYLVKIRWGSPHIFNCMRIMRSNFYFEPDLVVLGLSASHTV